MPSEPTHLIKGLDIKSILNIDRDNTSADQYLEVYTCSKYSNRDWLCHKLIKFVF